MMHASLLPLFAAGYTSGDVLADVPDPERARQEAQIRGSYREAFDRAVRPHLRPDARVLELGPGRGSWTRALLACIPRGLLHVIDPVDVRPWMPDDPRLFVHRGAAEDVTWSLAGWFDFVFSFGLLCHCDRDERTALLRATKRVTWPRGVAVHQYGDWPKLDALGWGDGCPTRDVWPENDPATMTADAEAAGWRVREADVGVFGRDSMCVLGAP